MGSRPDRAAETAFVLIHQVAHPREATAPVVAHTGICNYFLPVVAIQVAILTEQQWPVELAGDIRTGRTRIMYDSDLAILAAGIVISAVSLIMEGDGPGWIEAVQLLKNGCPDRTPDRFIGHRPDQD